MKGIIIYKGKYGATRQYADWLAETLKMPVADADQTRGAQLAAFDFFIIGSPVYFGKLLIRQWLRNNQSSLSRKRIFFFQVAGSPVEDIQKRNEYNRVSIPPELAVNGEFFFLPGKMIFRQLSWKDRLMMKAGAWLAKDPVEKKHMRLEYDAVSQPALASLVAAVQRRIKIPAPGKALEVAGN